MRLLLYPTEFSRQKVKKVPKQKPCRKYEATCISTQAQLSGWMKHRTGRARVPGGASSEETLAAAEIHAVSFPSQGNS